MKFTLSRVALLAALAAAGCGGGGKLAPRDAAPDVERNEGGVDTSTASPDGAPGRDAAPDHAAEDGDSHDATADLPDAAPAGDDGPADAAAATCHEITDGHVFVDPLAGVDDAAHTGARGCPHRSLTQALARLELARILQGAAAPDAVITIVNETAGVTLSAGTGETFPLTVPARVTITAEDPGRPPPIIQLTPGTHEGIILRGAGWHLSHLVVDCNGGGHRAVASSGGDGRLDHVKLEGCSGHALHSSRGTITIGPGVQIRKSNWGFKLTGGTAIVTGGAGAEHTSFSDNKAMGIWLHGGGSVAPGTRLQIDGRNVTAAAPAANDVSIDGNLYGIYFDLGPSIADVRGLHAAGNGVAIFLPGGPAELKLRGSFVANNAQSAIKLSSGALQPSSVIDLGRPGGADGGGNTFEVPDQLGTVNTKGALCVDVPLVGFAGIAAVGNVFGRTDCRQGGSISRAATCEGQVGVAGPGANAVDVTGCLPAPD